MILKITYDNLFKALETFDYSVIYHPLFINTFYYFHLLFAPSIRVGKNRPIPFTYWLNITQIIFLMKHKK